MKKIGIVLLGICVSFTSIARAAQVGGELKQWHRVAITIDGPKVAETDTPSPFIQYRMTVIFKSPNGETYVVPGHFSADGNASNSSASSGTQWRAYFAPPTTGTWSYEVNFREGEWIAVSDDLKAGTPVKGDGDRGSFQVAATDKSGRDFRAQGKLAQEGHLLKFRGSRKPWLKAGADSPENFLAVADFDGTKGSHKYAPHAKDWKSGDATWKGGKGKNIVGAVNYLASKGMNSIYFLTMNVNGDGKDVWPWTGTGAYSRFDVSKLDQWEVLFTHMESKGVMMHVVLQEAENSNLLDKGSLGNNRKLYYREMLSRFGHHNGIVWLLGEEVKNTTEQLVSFGRYFSAHDVYGSPVEVHTGPKSKDKIFTPLLGEPSIHSASLQHAMSGIYDLVRNWIDKSRAAGSPWLVFYDEQNPPKLGVEPDSAKPWTKVRTSSLWPTLMAGGAGVEWYFGSSSANNDLKTEDWRSRNTMWTHTFYAIDFFNRYLPYDRMSSSKLLSEGNLSLALKGSTYAVYTKTAEKSANLDLSDESGRFSIHWYNASKGGELQVGSIREVTGGSKQSIGKAPFSGDGAALVRKL